MSFEKFFCRSAISSFRYTLLCLVALLWSIEKVMRMCKESLRTVYENLYDTVISLGFCTAEKATTQLTGAWIFHLGMIFIFTKINNG